jgi:hypothetical protein
MNILETLHTISDCLWLKMALKFNRYPVCMSYTLSTLNTIYSLSRKSNYEVSVSFFLEADMKKQILEYFFNWNLNLLNILYSERYIRFIAFELFMYILCPLVDLVMETFNIYE